MQINSPVISLFMGNLSNLVDLYLDVNELPSSITEELGMLRSLGLFGLSRNHLNGSIPRKLDGLAFLYHSSNKLSGSIPAEFGMLRSVYQLQLWNISLTGQIMIP